MNSSKNDSNLHTCHNVENSIRFYHIDNEKFLVHGLLWYEENKNYQRLQKDVFINDQLSFLQKHSSGGYISFQSNSSQISIKVEVSQTSYMSHMPATGQCGLDLYVLFEGKYIFLATTKIDQISYTISLIKDFPKEVRQYRLYLPLYVELKSLEIGLDQDAIVEPAEKLHDNKIVCYGTSITQGGCASRPGMNYSSIIGRSVNYEVINLGFSGNAHLHPEIAEIIANIPNMKKLVLEVEANAGAIGVLKERLESFLQTILNKNHNLQVFIISHYPHPHFNFNKELHKRLVDHYEFQKNICEKYKFEFVDGYEVLKKFNYDETVDGVHLTDLGFYHIAQEMIKRFTN